MKLDSEPGSATAQQAHCIGHRKQQRNINLNSNELNSNEDTQKPPATQPAKVLLPGARVETIGNRFHSHLLSTPQKCQWKNHI